MAAPHVSGIAALAYSNNPELTTEEFRTVLRASADPVAGQPDTYNTRQGHGEVDAVKALELSNPNGYHEVESLTTPDTVTAGDDVEISTTIHNTNIIGGDGATDVTLYVNGEQVRTIASNVQVDSTDKQSVSTTYDTTGVSGAVNVSIGTADELQSQTMTVEAEDTTPPVPRLTYTPTSPSLNTTISFDASGTTDADSALETYQWDFNGDGTTDATGVTTTHTYTTAGEYDVTLTVTDTAGNTNTTTRTVYVRKEVEIRNATLTPTSVYSSPTSHTLTFNAVNVSADGSRDEFSISIPETVQLEAANSVEVTNKGFTPSYSTENNTIHFDVNRNSSEPSLDLNVRANVTLSSAI
jgi:PKD repeat protein